MAERIPIQHGVHGEKKRTMQASAMPYRFVGGLVPPQVCVK